MKPFLMLWSLGILGFAARAGEIPFVPREDWAQGTAHLDDALKQPAKIRLVTIHQTETYVAPGISREREKQILESIRHAHLRAGLSNNEKKLWGDIAYHYIIGPSGDVYLCRDPKFQSDSRTVLRCDLEGNLTICLIGDFRDQKEKSFDKPLHPTPDALPTPAALESLKSLVVMLLRQHNLDAGAVRAHRDLKMVEGGSDCPGGLFYSLIKGSLVPVIKERLAQEGKAAKSK